MRSTSADTSRPGSSPNSSVPNSAPPSDHSGQHTDRPGFGSSAKEIHMKTTRMMAAALIVASGLASHVLPSHARSTHGAPLGETVTVAADEPIPNLPGKRLVSHIVDYPPGASSAAHRHARSAFIYAYVLSGEIRSQVNG